METQFIRNELASIPATTGLGLVVPALLMEGVTANYLTTEAGQLLALALFAAFLGTGAGAIILSRKGKRSARLLGILSAVLGLALLGWSLAVIFDLLPAAVPSTFPTPQPLS